MSIAALFTISNTGKQSKCPATRRMDKEDVAHVYNRILLSHKKIDILPFAATWMHLEGIIPSQIGQPEKEKIPYDLTYMWNLKNTTN